MDMIADILLAAAAIGAGFYCFILGRRLNRFNNLEKGVGGAVAVLSVQVDDLNKSLSTAQATAARSAETLTELTAKAEDMSKRLELQMASMHDVPLTPEKSDETDSSPQHEVAPTQPMFMRRAETGASQ